MQFLLLLLLVPINALVKPPANTKIKIPPRVESIILTPSASHLPLPTSIPCTEVPLEPRPHIHLVGGTATDAQKLSIALDPILIYSSSSCLITHGKLLSTPSKTLSRARSRHIKNNELCTPVSCLRLPGLEKWSVFSAAVSSHVMIDNDGDDTSEVVTIEELVTPDLRKRLLSAIHGKEEGVDAHFWEKGAFRDVAGEAHHTGWGLNPTAMDGLLSFSDPGSPPSPLTELCYRIKSYLTSSANPSSPTPVRLTLLPYSIYGPSVAPCGANAPTEDDQEDCFGWHIDGDPFLAPPSGFRDCYGGYGNRDGQGKPRFVSALVYLNEEWEEEWGAGTDFLDSPSNEIYTTTVRPGRVVLLDSDVTHRVTRPKKAAGKRPRYSLVLKFLLSFEGDEDGGGEGRQPVRIAGEGADSNRVYFGSAAT